MSVTTPVRLVYNCSCRQSKHDVSLNDCLMIGDTPLNDLCGILICFRAYRITVTPYLLTLTMPSFMLD